LLDVEENQLPDVVGKRAVLTFGSLERSLVEFVAATDYHISFERVLTEAIYRFLALATLSSRLGLP
jgi:hypothetical protein